MAIFPTDLVNAPRIAIESARVRQDFPILERKVHGKPLVYLDSAATSQKPQAVLDAVTAYYHASNANVHRGVYLLAEEATELYERSRGKVCDFIGARAMEEVIFTRNATEAINLVSYTWGRKHVLPGDTVLITPMEHHSNFVPWQVLAHEVGANLKFVELTPDGQLDLDSLDSVLAAGRVKIVALAYISNVLGTINPIAEIVRRAHNAGAIVLVDGAQAVPHLPVDVTKLGVDF